MAILGPLLDKDEEKNYENHLLEWSNYCEGLKERAREVIGIIRAGTVSQVEKDRQYALSLARGEGREADGRPVDAVDGGPGEGGGAGAAPPAAVTLTGDEQSGSHTTSRR